MPQGSSNARTTSASSKKKGRAPAHQNAFAFHHNPKSKKTEKILSSPNTGVCQRCYDKIEWRKKYRKYKPRTQPGICNQCQNRTVMAAYHTICTTCTTTEQAYKRMTSSSTSQVGQEKDDGGDDENQYDNDHVEKHLVHSAANLTMKCSSPTSQNSRVCAMCVKDMALSDANHDGDEAVDDASARQNRYLTLRERRSIERKLVRQQEGAKQAAKEARWREREANGENTDRNDSVNDNDEDMDSVHEENAKDSSVSDDDDEQDPFLQAVGGKSKVLVGEAYQSMLLERERQDSSPTERT